MGLLDIIRRMALREKQPMREISRRRWICRIQVMFGIFGHCTGMAIFQLDELYSLPHHEHEKRRANHG